MIQTQQTSRHRSGLAQFCAVLVVALLTLVPAAVAQEGNDDDSPGRVRVLSSSYDADTTFGSLIGGQRQGTMTVTLSNISDQTVSGIDIVLEANGSTRRLDPIDMAVDETRTLSFPVNFDQGQWGPQDMTASFNGFDVEITHWNMPWILIGLVAFVLNLLLLNIRNGLRNRVRKQLIARRRADDLGQAEAPTSSLQPAIQRARRGRPAPKRGSSQLSARN